MGEFLLSIPLTPKTILHALLYRILYGNWQDKGTVLIKTKNAFLYGRSSDIVAMSLLEEPKTCSLIMRLIKSKPNGTFLDLGAHVGSYTVAAAKQGWRVIALEPAPETFRYLNRNILFNRLDNVEALNIAIWSHNGFAWLYNSSNQEGDNSLINKTDWGKVQVRTSTLTNLLSGIAHIDIAKMDIEGAEIEVIVASNDLTKVENWVIETSCSNAPRLFKLMKERGFSGKVIENLIRGGSLVNIHFYRQTSTKSSKF